MVNKGNGVGRCEQLLKKADGTTQISALLKIGFSWAGKKHKTGGIMMVDTEKSMNNPGGVPFILVFKIRYQFLPFVVITTILLFFRIVGHGNAEVDVATVSNRFKTVDQLFDKFESEGHQIIFSDSSKFDYERRIVRDILDISKVEKESYGAGKETYIKIALEDIDLDGNIEILAYVIQEEMCGLGGGLCTFVILKKDSRGKFFNFYENAAYEDISLLDTQHDGYRDIVFKESYFSPINSTDIAIIFKFNGKKYQPYLMRERVNNNGKEDKTIRSYDYKFDRWNQLNINH